MTQKMAETDMMRALMHSSCKSIFVTNMIAIKDEFQQDGRLVLLTCC